MEDKHIFVIWDNYIGKIKTIGHQMPDGWWYVYTPFDNDWHYVPENRVEVV